MNFTQVLDRLGSRIKAIAYKAGGRYFGFSYEDLCQEAIFHLWQNQDKLADKTDSYILQSCYFFLKNFIRKNNGMVERNCFSMDDSDSEQNDPFSSFLADESQELRDVIDGRLIFADAEKILDYREREILRLLVHGFTVREIGFQLGVSHVMVVKIKNRINDKLEQFKDELQ